MIKIRREGVRTPTSVENHKESNVFVVRWKSKTTVYWKEHRRVPEGVTHTVYRERKENYSYGQ